MAGDFGGDAGDPGAGHGGGFGGAGGIGGNSGPGPSGGPDGSSGPSKSDIDIANAALSIGLPQPLGLIHGLFASQGMGLGNIAQGGNVDDYGGGDPDAGGGPDFGGSGSKSLRQKPAAANNVAQFMLPQNQVQNDIAMGNQWGGQQMSNPMNPVPYTQHYTPAQAAVSPFGPGEQMDWGGFFKLFGGK